MEKGVARKDYWLTRLDVLFGCIVTDVIALFIVVARFGPKFWDHGFCQGGVPIGMSEERGDRLGDVDKRELEVLVVLATALGGEAPQMLRTTADH